jgi:hypothetical protein
MHYGCENYKPVDETHGPRTRALPIPFTLTIIDRLLDVLCLDTQKIHFPGTKSAAKQNILTTKFTAGLMPISDAEY